MSIALKIVITLFLSAFVGILGLIIADADTGFERVSGIIFIFPLIGIIIMALVLVWTN